MIKKHLFIFFTLLVLLLSSCNSNNINDSTNITGRQISVRIQKEECVFEKLSPAKTSKQLFDLSGKTPKTDILRLKTQTTLRVYWNQQSTNDFELSITKLNPDQTVDPSSIIVLESIIGPSSGCTDVTLETGDYEVNVENANNDWKLIIDAISH